MKVTRSVLCLYVVVLSCLGVVLAGSTKAFAGTTANVCGCTNVGEEMDGAVGSGLDLGCYNDCKYGHGKFRGKGWENHCNSDCKSWAPQNQEICCFGGKTKGGTSHNGCCTTVRNVCLSACVKKGAAISAISRDPNLIPEVILAVLAGVDPVAAIDTYMTSVENSAEAHSAEPQPTE
ncbi:MAG: hypothetical protein RL326_1668 [Pseudomonadota bacterium]|jgi:hypothetical protein